MIDKSIFREYVKTVRQSEQFHFVRFETGTVMTKSSVEAGGCRD